MLPIVVIALIAAVALPATAQPLPYAGFQSREVKALSPEETADLQKGRGMGASLAAEMNGYPGPLHVIELAESLALSALQRQAAEDIVDRMRAEAQALGGEIVARERALDGVFAAQAAESAAVVAEVEEIGLLRGRLRAVHLHAHLETYALLSAPQRQAYPALRGYDGNPGAHGHRH